MKARQDDRGSAFVGGSSAGAPAGPGGAFRFCPGCGAPEPDFLEGKRWLCRACGFELYHNVATATGLVLDRPEGIVFLERAQEPRAGKLGLPGGFANPGERAEDSLRRECLEEIGWAPREVCFLGSFPNAYPYRGIVYNTCDLYFYHRAQEEEDIPELSPCDGEARSIRLIPLAAIRPEDLAFGSTARAIAAYAELARSD